MRGLFTELLSQGQFSVIRVTLALGLWRNVPL